VASEIGCTDVCLGFYDNASKAATIDDMHEPATY
jgi:hypothetical protein